LFNQFASGAVSRFFFHEGNLLFVDNVKFSVVIKTNAELDGRITCTAAKDCELLEHRASGFQPPEKDEPFDYCVGKCRHTLLLLDRQSLPIVAQCS